MFIFWGGGGPGSTRPLWGNARYGWAFVRREGLAHLCDVLCPGCEGRQRVEDLHLQSPADGGLGGAALDAGLEEGGCLGAHGPGKREELRTPEGQVGAAHVSPDEGEQPGMGISLSVQPLLQHRQTQQTYYKRHVTWPVACITLQGVYGRDMGFSFFFFFGGGGGGG